MKITYIGGGSRFVVTLLHGLASKAAELKTLGQPIELALLDPNAQRAGDMSRYAQITAKQTGLDIRPIVTNDRPEALKDAALVILSAGIWQPIMAARQRFESPHFTVHGEHGPGVAIEAAALWPFLSSLAKDMKKYATSATFATLVNPTDVIAGAFEKAFGIPSIGICVEVGGLIGWLSYYLGIDESRIHLDHVGLNHTGWVSNWCIDGVADAKKLFWETIPGRMQMPDWYPHPEFFVRLYEKTGFMRSSPYHNWPYRTPHSEERQKRMEVWAAACLPGGKSKRDFRDEALNEALAAGRMIGDFDGRKVHPEATPYTYPNSRHTLGALAVAFAGGSSEPVSLQVRNGKSNPTLPEDAWIEVPTILEKGKATPRSIKPLPEFLLSDTRSIAVQRSAIADWLAGGDEQGLAKGLYAYPQSAPVNDIARICDELTQVRDAQT